MPDACDPATILIPAVLPAYTRMGKGFGKTPGFIRGDEPKPFVNIYHLPVGNIYIS